jgi:sodium/hydrogen exchanger-like protein 6/7
MKHYAYHNMSRRTQLTTKFVFQVTAQLSENFIFIYLGLSLFTESSLVFKPLFIIITVIGICVARWCAVFPLSRLINWVIRYRARRQGNLEVAEEIPYSHQAMLFWAGLRGAVGVALAAGLSGPNAFVLRATVLVVVVLTVIIFGGTTASMLEILNIRTGVVEEIDSDDEFDIEYISSNGNGTYARKSGGGIGHIPRPSAGANGFALGDLDEPRESSRDRNGTYSSGNHSPSNGPYAPARRNSSKNLRSQDAAEQGLLSPADTLSLEADEDDLDLPPAARRPPVRQPSPRRDSAPPMYPTSGSREHPEPAQGRLAAAAGAVGQLISGLSEDPADAFRLIDENFIKPRLLLDPGSGGHGQGHGGSGNGAPH